MTQNVSAPQSGAHDNAQRFNGTQERGFAFGKARQAVPVETPATDTVEVSSAPSSAPVTYSQLSETLSSTPAPGGANAQAVTKDGTFDINVTIAAASAAGKGTVHFEDGGSYAFSPSDHPGAKYRIVGLEGGNGVTNPHNIKGTIYLKDAPGGVAEALADKAGDFFRKRDAILADAGEEAKKAPKAGKITREDLVAFNLLQAPDVGILNIHDDRFDKSKFTGREVQALQVAAKLEASVGPGQAGEQGKGHGLKLGHERGRLDHALKNPLFA